MKTASTSWVIVCFLVAGQFVVTSQCAISKDTKRDSNDSKAEATKEEEANTLFAKGKAEAREARRPENAAERDALRTQAREDFAAAREIYQEDHDRYKKEYDKFDKFIPKEQKEKYEARELAFRRYIQAQLRLALLLYEEAQNWDKGSAENRKLLINAADAFETIHARYRQMVAGLYARMWEGKCFEERDDLAKALGLYNELLGHGGDKPSPPLAVLQDQVRHFRLICLNRDERKDYQIVIREAEEWLEHNEEKGATPAGLGIQWELARALEFQASNTKKAAEKKPLLERALAAAKAVSDVPSEYKEAAEAMIERLEPGPDANPKGAK